MKTTILADIGGTHARFARLEDGVLSVISKIPVAGCGTFMQALTQFAGPARGERLLLSLAANAGPDGVWRFFNFNDWRIDPAELDVAGWSDIRICNDFAAAGYGLASLGDDEIEHLNAGIACAAPRALVGIGTGLGLSFLTLHPAGEHVQNTHGGHMIAAAHTTEQRDILQRVAAELPQGRAEDSFVVFEDVVSGRGLMHLYRAVTGREAQSPQQAADHVDVLRLFHEFLGLFLHTATVTANAYGGVYLTGGVLDGLMDRSLFDRETVLRFMRHAAAPVVARDLAATPVGYVRERYLGLRGLEVLARKKEDGV